VFHLVYNAGAGVGFGALSWRPSVGKPTSVPVMTERNRGKSSTCKFDIGVFTQVRRETGKE
jgi:hypothetical protein